METNNSKKIILVPGSFHGAWCFYKVLPLLKKNGAAAVALDLPGHGKDKTPISSITLNSYVNAVGDELNKQSGTSILVGHSRAGIILSQVAEKYPEKISSLVYLAAYLIPNGEPMVATALTDSGSVLAANLIFNEQEGWHMPGENSLQEALYHDCSLEDIELAKSLISKEPNLPVATPLQITDERFGLVNKVYIETLYDKAITNHLQKSMLAKNPVNKIFKMETSHSPFFSKPGELADILMSLT